MSTLIPDDFSRIGDAGWLREHGLFVAEGRLVVQRLLACGRFVIRSILVTPAAWTAIRADVRDDVPVFVAAQAVVNGVTGFNFHRGCLALAERPADPPLASFTGGRRLLALEGVGNPDNVGGLFRVAAAFGVEGVLLDPTSGDPFYRKAVRTSMGAALSVSFTRVDPWPDGLRPFHEAGVSVVALSPRADAEPLDAFAARHHERTIIMVGAEGSGLGEAALSLANARVRIPIARDVDSLNVVVAAGIALSRICRM